MLMGSLNDPVVANMLILFLSGLVMVVTLWFSKKARAVSDTEINLARQDVGVERFGSTSISRAIVRSALNVNRNYEKYTPTASSVSLPADSCRCSTARTRLRST